jgi:S1-C subfamily serine protease
MFTKIGSFLGSVAFAVLVALSCHAEYEVVQQVQPPSLEQQLGNVVSIYTADGHAYCSGWVLKGTHTVVTAAHCTDDMIAQLFIDFGDGKPHPFHVQKYGDSNWKIGPDLMTLTTNDATIHWPAGLGVCPFKPYYGEAVNLVGGPLAYEKTLSQGHISNPSRDMNDKIPNTTYAGAMIQYDGVMLPGNSGGPAIDQEVGCVLGVADFIVPVMPDFPYPYGLTFLTPASDLGKLK